MGFLDSGGLAHFWAKVKTALSAKQDKLTGTAGQVVGFNAEGEAVAQPGAGRTMAGQTVEPVQGTTVTAGDGAEIFNDYRTRTFTSKGKADAGNIASGGYSHAEGHITTASGEISHAEGCATTASGPYSHAEGYFTEASGEYSHAEGYNTSAKGKRSHAEGYVTTASGGSSHAEGNKTTASGDYSHAEGAGTTASKFGSHAEGLETTASGPYSHAEGAGTETSGQYSHAEGGETVASGDYSHATGFHTVAGYFATTAIGSYNKPDGGENPNVTKNLLIVGNGTGDSSRSNAFRVDNTGNCYGIKAWNSSGADYAELFEWLDSNPDAEDRAGLFVTLEGDRLRLAGPEDDFILGIVSADPSVVGDVYDDQWAGMYLRDVFGRTIMEMQDFPAETTQVPREDGTMETVELIPARRELAPVVNPEYDHTVKYLPRTQRPEWDAVGMMGKLVAVDDGTCRVNGWCTAGQGGKATHSDTRTRCRVMARLDETHIRVLIL